jgi:sugar/nucleoside kinase (ribokinase family)
VSVAATSIKNPVLVVGSVALDSVETPFGKADEVLGGSGTYFSSSASHFTPVQLVGVVGDDYPVDKLEPLAARGVDLAGLEKAEGTSFRWRGRYRHDLNSAETLETHLGVFSHFRPKIPEQFRHSPFVFLANIDPRLQLQVLEQVEKPRLVACDTMNFWIESRRPEVVELLGHVDLITLNDAEARQLTEHTPISCRPRAGSWTRAPSTYSSRRASTGRSCSRARASSSRPRTRWRACSIPRAPATRLPGASLAISPQRAI